MKKILQMRKVISLLKKRRQKVNVKVVVGLGNPGGKYEGTPHNVGFEAVDRLADRIGCQFKYSLRFKAEIAKTAVGADQMLLVKPQTFMNLSGEAVGALLRFYKATAADLIVLFDDVDLDVGRIRIRPGGGSGGHKGLTSVIQHVGTGDFVRVRMGVGRGVGTGDVVSHVLRKFASCHRDSVDSMIERAVDAVYKIQESGVDAAMNRFNSMVPDQS
jgi:PTH1 family peptidyl-tRNA hydrolase